jgi:hypothetical protein
VVPARGDLDGLAAQQGAVGKRLGRNPGQVQQDFARVVNAIARFEPVNLVVDPPQAEARPVRRRGALHSPAGG